MPIVSVDPAPWLETLPRESRGFLVPAETPWLEGQARLALVGTEWKVAQAFLRACAVCGWTLKAGQPVYRAFSQGDAATVRGYERDTSHDISGPAHLSCMLYSAITCPYLREPTSRLGRESLINPGKPRGRLAAVMGFEDAALLVYRRAHAFLSPDAPVPYFTYHDLMADIRFTKGEDLVSAYEVAVGEDAPHITITGTRAVFTSETDPELWEVIRRGHQALSDRSPDFQAEVFGEPYAGFQLPVLTGGAAAPWNIVRE